MSSLLHQLSSHSTSILSRATRFFGTRNHFSECSTSLSWRTSSVTLSSFKTFDSAPALVRFRIYCYSTSSSSSSACSPVVKTRRSRSRKKELEPAMGEEKEAFFVVRKGDIVGIYKTLGECQAQVGSSVCDPPVSVYKGYSLPKDAEVHLLSRGLQNALYTINASDWRDELFGKLEPCLFQEPLSSTSKLSSVHLPQKRSSDAVESENLDSCVLEFDGASKGNPGKAGAGAVLRTSSGSLICKLQQGLGFATCNAAEYKAVILGLKSALDKGYRSIRVQGDSKLVCMQIQGLWKVKHEHMAELHAIAKELKEKFLSFQISHVLREFNSEADAQANLATDLADGQVREISC